jgi:magnesium-transporting ATPase (P-type)
VSRRADRERRGEYGVGVEGSNSESALHAVTEATSTRGLTREEAARRLAERGPVEPPATSRSYRSIVRANVFTVFNLILAVFGVLTLALGDWRDALFLGVLVANSTIGITQEVRAKRALDRLAALVAPTATVVRDGEPEHLHVSDVVDGDLVRVEAGDQLVADGRLEDASGLRLDESILTGESDAVTRDVGEEVRSGSFVVEGAGAYVVTAVGKESYAERIAGEARAFRHPRSPLERALNRLLLALVVVMIPLGLLLAFALWRLDVSVDEAVPRSVAAVVSLVPEGLILLTSLTYAVAALRMARRGALVQQLNAIESLAAVDVVCMDKTGTLTEGTLRVVELVPSVGLDVEQLGSALARFAASSPSRNTTLAAIAAAREAPPEEAEEHVPFASRRGWSSVTLAGTTYVLGTPERFPLGPLAVRATQEARRGRRVLAFGTAAGSSSDADPLDPPPGLEPLGLVVLAEQLRKDAGATVAFFRRQGVELKVISGDAPDTVAAIATDAGMDSSSALDGRELPDDDDELRRLALATGVVGRISPEGKKRVVEALTASGRYVAMVGDGVNDVPALKAARLAIAQGSGAQIAKSVADLVLVRGEFSAVPSMVDEGRRILRNLQRVAKLFVTKSAFAAFLILSIGLTPLAYPLLPRHLTLAASLTVGIPGFFLALAPSSGRLPRTSFLRDVAQFAVPAGAAAGLGVLSSYLFSSYILELDLVEARTVATSVLILVGLYLILVLEASTRLRSAAVSMLCLALLGLYALVLAVPGAREFFELAVPGPAACVTAVVGAGLAVAGLWLTDDRFVPGGGSAVAQVDEPVDGPDHDRAADDVPDRHREEVVEEEGAPGQP